MVRLIIMIIVFIEIEIELLFIYLIHVHIIFLCVITPFRNINRATVLFSFCFVWSRFEFESSSLYRYSLNITFMWLSLQTVVVIGDIIIRSVHTLLFSG